MGLFKRRPSTEGDKLMAVPTKSVIDCATGVVSEIPLSDEEMAQREVDAANAATAAAEREAEEAQKAAIKQSAQEKLKALGLTDLEVAAIAGV